MSTKKKKSTKLSLQEFFMDEATGSWADQTLELPTAPMAAFETVNEVPTTQSHNYSNRDHGKKFDRYENRRGGGGREFQPQKPLPERPPFIAYVGNLNNEAVEKDLEELFEGLKVTSVKIMKDSATSRSRGYGYVEFSDLASLEVALKKNSETHMGRSLRVDVAEGDKKKERPPFERGDGDSRRNTRPVQDEPQLPSNWRRENQLPVASENHHQLHQNEERPFRSKNFQSNQSEQRESRGPRGPRESREPREAKESRGFHSQHQQDDGLDFGSLRQRRLQEQEQQVKKPEVSKPSSYSKPSPYGNSRPVDKTAETQHEGKEEQVNSASAWSSFRKSDKKT